MANENLLEYRIRINREGLAELATDLEKVGTSSEKLSTASTGTGGALDKMQGLAKSAGFSLTQVAQATEQAGAEIQAMRQAVDAKTAAIKAGLQAEQSEIELQRQHLAAAGAEQQAIARSAATRGDEATATQAQNRLRQIEADQLGLVARAKRAEATAMQQAVDARREELAAIGPLTQAQANELRAAENHAKALRVEAAAADQAGQRSRDLTTAHKNNAAATDQLGNRVQGLSQLLGQMAGALGAAFTFRELVTSAAQMEQLRSGLTAVTQDATKAGQELEFVRVVANRIGADVTEVGKAFLGLAASTRGTAVEGEPTRQVFEAVATAMGKAGKSSAETSNALNALSQMASKGVVQSEELRGQLGEALPGALNAAAKGLGLTTAELTKMVEEGKITAEDLFPALARGLNELYGGAPQALTLEQSLVNVKNAFTGMSERIGDAGGLSVLKVGAELTSASITLLGEGLVATGKRVGVLMGALTTLDFKGVKQAFADIEAEARDKLIKAAQHNSVLRQAIEAVGSDAQKVALKQQQAAQATAAASTAAAQSADNWVRLNNGYRLVLESVREQIAQAEKSMIAREAEGKASVALAQAFGTEKEQRDAQVKAAEANAAALGELAKQRLTELATMKAQLQSLQEEAKAHGKLSEERTKQKTELEKQIGLRQADTDKAVAQAQASRLAAEQAKAEAEAYKDNSARVNELREAYDRAKAKLEEVRAAKAAGKVTTEDVTKAELAAGKAALLYRDALQDQLKTIEAKRNLQQVEIDVQSATLRLAMEHQRAIYEVAKARGDEKAATAAQNEIRRLEIELLILTAQAKRAEADAAIASAEAKKAELIAAGQYNGAKKLEIEAAIKAAEVKRMEGDIAEVTANKLRNLAQVQGSLKSSMDTGTGAIHSQAAAMERLADGVERVGQGYRNKDGLTSDAKGNVQQQFVWTQSSVVDYLKQAGLDELLAERLSKDFLDSKGDVPYLATDAQKKWGGRYGTLSSALGKMAEYYKYNDQGQADAAQILQSEKSRKSTPQSGGQGGGSPGATYISNITIDGEQTTVRFADAESQSNGEDLLRKLKRAKGAAAR